MSQFTEKEIINKFHPAIREWFEGSFESPTPPQLKGWPPIMKGENTLILAPTGSGKTLAAFLVCIHNLLQRLTAKEEPDGIHTLYISPLKALNYDIERNLEDFPYESGVVDAQFKRARCCENLGDCTKAVKLYTDFLLKHPKDRRYRRIQKRIAKLQMFNQDE